MTRLCIAYRPNKSSGTKIKIKTNTPIHKTLQERKRERERERTRTRKTKRRRCTSNKSSFRTFVPFTNNMKLVPFLQAPIQLLDGMVPERVTYSMLFNLFSWLLNSGLFERYVNVNGLFGSSPLRIYICIMHFGFGMDLFWGMAACFGSLTV